MVGDNVCSIAVDDLVIGLVMVDIVILYIISLLSTVGTQVWDLRLCILTPIIAMLMLTPFVMINHCGRLVGVKHSKLLFLFAGIYAFTILPYTGVMISEGWNGYFILMNLFASGYFALRIDSISEFFAEQVPLERWGSFREFPPKCTRDYDFLWWGVLAAFVGPWVLYLYWAVMLAT
ncbi:MAG: hypothetical protein FWH15_06645 [Betaproteobacteria bacterium]|nr:hypothetical protein [Betaproteobacteria bacterium]